MSTTTQDFSAEKIAFLREQLEIERDRCLRWQRRHDELGSAMACLAIVAFAMFLVLCWVLAAQL